MKRRTNIELEFRFYDKLAKLWREFVPQVQRSVLTFRADVSEVVLRELLAKEGYKAGDVLERRQVAIVGPTDKEFRPSELSKYEEILNVMPSVIDKEGYRRSFVPDEVLVLTPSNVSREQIERRLREDMAGAEILTEISAMDDNSLNVLTISVPEGSSLFRAINVLGEMEEVLFAGPVEIYSDATWEHEVVDPESEIQWGLARIQAEEAWARFTPGDPRVVVAVIDSGAHLSHPELSPNILARNGEDWDFLDPDPSPDDRVGHGTHICGIATAVRNGVGVVGVAPGCSVMPLRVWTTPGNNVDRINALLFVAWKARTFANLRFVANCSWNFTGGDDGALHAAIISAVQSNVLVVASAGNDGVSPQSYPAFYPEVVSVVATNTQDVKWPGSNYGRTCSVSAPGFRVVSTWLGGTYARVSGTSQAAPHVAGVAALIWSKNMNLRNWRVRQILEDPTSCDRIDHLNPPHLRGKLGAGRVNALKALNNTP